MLDMVKCFNQGCGKTYNEEDNNEDACLYHPKPPYFHDAYKIWPCCNKKSYDFTDFLAIPGCTRAKHNPNKNVELLCDIKNKLREASQSKKEEIFARNAIVDPESNKNRKEFEIGDSFQIVPTVNSELKSLIDNLQIEAPVMPADSVATASEYTPKIGDSCSNYGCTKVYCTSFDNDEECYHHFGGPIFHEGSKYWNCCKIKCSDFNEFLRQKGCTIGKHNFSPKKIYKDNFVRNDFFHQNEYVIVSFYAKKIDYRTISIAADSYNIFVKFNYENKKRLDYEQSFQLFDQIIPEKSSAKITPYKLELKLYIINQGSTWPSLTV